VWLLATVSHYEGVFATVDEATNVDRENQAQTEREKPVFIRLASEISDNSVRRRLKTGHE
jgi:hypothetical protein